MKNITTWIIVILIVLIGGWLLITPSESVDRDSVTIGVILPLTGELSEYGNDELNAIRLFMKENNLEEKFKLLIEDSQSDVKHAVSIVNKILLSEPDAFITLGSSISLAVQPLLNERKIPTFSVGANPKIASGYMIQNLPTSVDYVEKISDEINKDNIGKLGVLYKNDDLGVSVKDSLLKKIDSETVLETFNQNEKDFRTIITKIKAEKPDALFIVNTGTSFGTLIKQIREQMGNILIYSVPEITANDVKETAGNAYTNIIYSDLIKPKDNSLYKKFEEAYKKEYSNMEVSFDAILAYNEMILLNECSKEKENLFDCLINIKTEGLNGKLSIENNRIKYEMVVKKIGEILE